MFKFTSLTCVLMLGSAAVSAQVVSSLPEVRTTGMVGVGQAQSAQLNLLNPGLANNAVGVICTAGVSFVDAAGAVLKTGTVSVAPGTSASFVLREGVDLKLAVGDHRELRAVITRPAVPPAATSSASAAKACKLIPTLEILDNGTGRTLVILGRTRVVPSIAAAAQ